MRPVCACETRSNSLCTSAASRPSHLSSTTRVWISSGVSMEYFAVTWASSAFCASLTGLLLDEGRVGFERLAFVGGVLVVLDLLESGLDADFGEFTLVD